MVGEGSTFCSFIPPHIYERLGRGSDVAVAAAAASSDRATTRLRGQRDVYSLLPALSITPNTMRRTIYSASAQETLPGSVVRSEGAPSSGDACVDGAYDNAEIVWEFYGTVFARDSLDGRGMRLDSTVHYGVGYDNAFWNGAQMIYGDGDGTIFSGFASALDVIGHEMTHGVTQNASGLVYQGQSGALNEHLSDVFGTLIKHRFHKTDAASASWLIGESIIIIPNPLQAGEVCRGVRDMLHPGTAYANLAFGSDPQPDSFDNLNTSDADNGGVHINSGIPNRAFALYAVAIGGNAWEEAGSVWYKAATASGLSQNADFAEFRAATIAAAETLAPTTVPALVAAWQAVKVP